MSNLLVCALSLVLQSPQDPPTFVKKEIASQTSRIAATTTCIVP